MQPVAHACAAAAAVVASVLSVCVHEWTPVGTVTAAAVAAAAGQHVGGMDLPCFVSDAANGRLRGWYR